MKARVLEPTVTVCQTCIGDSVEMDLRRSLQGHRIAGVANEARLSGVTHKSAIFLEIKCFSKTEIFVQTWRT